MCIGPTGLSSNSTDLFEESGCQSGSDNFLASIDVNAGDILFLAVISFSTNNKYTIEHSGSAEITCLSLGIEEMNQNEVTMFPNPTNDMLNFEVADNGSQKYEFELYSATGEKVLTSHFLINTSVDISDLPKGIYYARIWTDVLSSVYKKVIKI